MELLSVPEDILYNTTSEEKADIAIQDKQLGLKRERVSILSPLRYPGSKRRLAGYIKKMLQLNCLRPSLFVEPFAGGASVALQLLNDDVVDTIGLIDLDPLIAAFWETVFFDSDWLLQQIETIEITLDQWYRFKQSIPQDTRERALACLFLNRTSFSGILAPGAGPLGGRAQNSSYPIDCRFPRKTLIKRVQQATALKDRVAFVWNISWHDGIERVQHLSQNVLYYFDPPFFEKANQLYTYYFKENDHRCLRDSILALELPWILSYDVSDQVNTLYGSDRQGSAHVELLYSTAGRGGNRVVQEVIITNLEQLSGETRLWKSSREWRQ